MVFEGYKKDSFVNMMWVRFHHEGDNTHSDTKIGTKVLKTPLKFEFSFDNKTMTTLSLQSFVVHSGSTGGGHYWCFADTPRGWMQFDNTSGAGPGTACTMSKVRAGLEDAYTMFWKVDDVRL